MSKYLTRVLIKDAVQADYDKLDLEMRKGLFVRIKNNTSKEASPSENAREYNYAGMKDLQAVITAAYTAASRVGKQYSLTVMKEKRAV